jgi:serine/threonine protein kinase
MKPESERYELQDEIGKGGMGTVYRARDRKLQRLVALKRLHSNLATDALAVGRLQKEASLAATLEHPNIVRIYDVIRDEQGAFITMEHVSGESLAAHIEKYGALRPYQAMSICQKVGEALWFAHSKGVVHLDVKPANILIAGSGEPRLTDFGIASWIQDQGELTRELMGTPEYAAPEQAKADMKPDARADVYSLAATLYAMITGKSPHVIRESEIPKPFRPLLLKALSRDPQGRHADMDAFLSGLRAVNPHKRSPWPALAVAGVSLFVIALLAWVLVSTEPDAEPAPETTAVIAKVEKPKRDPVTPAKTSGTIAPAPEAKAEFEALNVVTAGKSTWAY